MYHKRDKSSDEFNDSNSSSSDDDNEKISSSSKKGAKNRSMVKTSKIGGFSSKKLNLALKTSAIRLKIHANKLSNPIPASKRELANLLREGKEESARIKAQTVIRDEKLCDAFAELQLICEQLSTRLDILKTTKLLTEELRIPVCSLVYASYRVGDIPELIEARKLLEKKFSSTKLERAISTEPETHLSQTLIHRLNQSKVDQFLIDGYLTEIARINGIRWKAAHFNETPIPLLPPDLSAKPPTSTPTTISISQLPSSTTSSSYTSYSSIGSPIQSYSVPISSPLPPSSSITSEEEEDLLSRLDRLKAPR